MPISPGGSPERLNDQMAGTVYDDTAAGAVTEDQHLSCCTLALQLLWKREWHLVSSILASVGEIFVSQ
jgi:hypothetical protein